MPGYHVKKIQRGVLGESSKIAEELAELQDAEEQNNEILALCEAADIYGALEHWVERHGFTMWTLKKMSDSTRSAFADGSRK